MNYRDAQRLYLQAGWPGVLPLPARAKFPPPEGFTGRGAPYPDAKQLEAWRNGGGDGNLCLRLPEGVLGIDVDSYDGKPGAETLSRLEGELGPLPETWFSSARDWPSGIRFFRVPPGRAWRDPGPGLEVIHAGWRYAVAWPSVHPNGSEYRWGSTVLLHWSDAGWCPNLTDLPTLPEAWVRYLDAGEAKPYVTSDVDVEWLDAVAPKNPEGWEKCPVMLDSASRHVDNIRGAGSRHDAMNTGISAVIHLAGNGHRGGEEAIALLRQVFEETVTDRSTWGEFNRSLVGAIQKEGLSLEIQSPPCLCGAPAPVATSVDSGPVPDEDTRDFGQLYLPVTELDKLTRPPALIEDVLDGASLFAVTGRDGMLKSFMVIDWLACLATGQSWFGKPARQCKVLYVVGEGVYGLDARVKAWQHHRGVKIDGDRFHVRLDRVNLFRAEAAYTDLLQRVEAEQYQVIVFDTLQRMASGADTNSARDTGVILDRLSRIRQITGSGSVGIVAHSGKTDRDIRGSSAWEDDLDMVWRLKEDDGNVSATLDKRRDGPSGASFRLAKRIIQGSLVLEQVVGRATGDQEPASALPLLRGLLNAPEGGLSHTALVREAGIGATSAFYKPMNWLVGKSWVTKLGSGNRTRYVLSPPGRSRLAELGYYQALTRGDT